MATVKIELTDHEDKTVDIKVDFDPPMPPEQQVEAGPLATNAHLLAFRMLKAIS